MRDEKELQIINIDITTAFLFIISILVSIFLTFERKRDIENKGRILNENIDQYIALINRLFVLGIVFVILYDNYMAYQLAKEKKEDIKPNTWQIVASIFGVLSAIIILYVTIYNFNSDNQDAGLENIIF